MAPLCCEASERRVLVTGAAGGIGRAVVAALAGRGCTVAACDAPGVRLDDLGDLAATVHPHSFDLRDPAGVRAEVESVTEAFGGLDAVVANAGVVDTIHRAERFPDDEWRSDLEINLFGAFYVIRAAFAALARGGDGRVVVISSVAAQDGLPGQVAYGASKAGLVGMARTLAAEWAPSGIRCNVVMPGMVATPKVLAMPEALRTGVARSIPLGRFADPAELAGTVSFLLSPAAAYLTGAVLRVDGGLGLGRALAP